MWANHGDDISLQYAGTGALKSGFTRTGVRTKAGLADDGWKSGVRYYLNNFEDGHKQDAFDLVSGSYIINKGLSFPPCQSQIEPSVQLREKLFYYFEEAQVLASWEAGQLF